MRILLFVFLSFTFAGALMAESLTAEQKAAVDAKLTALKAWGSAPEVVAAVKLPPPSWAVAMKEDQWKALSILSAEVKELSKNALATWIRGKKEAAVSEAFVSRADGTKVAFLGKTTSWSHKGKPKHEVPMTGKLWIGEVETDESTGVKQVQVSFPVLDGSTVIGSVVVGLQLSKL